MKTLVCILLCAFVIGSVRVSAYAERPEVDVTLDIGKLSGHTTYQIGGKVDTPSGSYKLHFPISELEFPLDVYMASIGGSIEFQEKWKVSVDVKKNITDDAGKMKDSDWMTSSNPDQLDIYSESDAELDALIVDISFRFKFLKKSRWSLSGGVGYIHQNFDYDIYDLDQWYPSGVYGTGVDHVDGKVLEYEVTYSIPYVEIGTQFKIKDKFSLEASLGYSPIVNVEDEDHHLLRSKVSKGDCDGKAILLSLEGRYDFLKHWFLTLQVDYTKIDTDGTSRAYFYGVYDHTIDQEIESEQVFTAFSVGYAF